MMATLIGERIRFKRLEQGLTMEELGKRLGVGKSAVNKWEKGTVKNIKLDHLKEMANIFNCDPLWLLHLDSPCPDDCDNIRSLQEKIAEQLSEYLMDDTKAVMETFNQYVSEVEPVEPHVRTGHWIEHQGYDQCSWCGNLVSAGINYCPYCGSRNIFIKENVNDKC